MGYHGQPRSLPGKPLSQRVGPAVRTKFRRFTIKRRLGHLPVRSLGRISVPRSRSKLTKLPPRVCYWRTNLACTEKFYREGSPVQPTLAANIPLSRLATRSSQWDLGLSVFLRASCSSFISQTEEASTFLLRSERQR